MIYPDWLGGYSSGETETIIVYADQFDIELDDIELSADIGTTDLTADIGTPDLEIILED